MIKVQCNICNKDIDQQEFIFEAAIIQTVAALTGNNLQAQNQRQKTVVHICKDCYETNFKDLIYGKK